MESVSRMYYFYTQTTKVSEETALVTEQVARWLGKCVRKRV